jgi:hypothetical protein
MGERQKTGLPLVMAFERTIQALLSDRVRLVRLPGNSGSKRQVVKVVTESLLPNSAHETYAVRQKRLNFVLRETLLKELLRLDATSAKPGATEWPIFRVPA